MLKTTADASRLRCETYALSSALGPAGPTRLSNVVVAVVRSRRKTSLSMLPSVPGTRSVTFESNATFVPSPLTCGLPDAAFPDG